MNSNQIISIVIIVSAIAIVLIKEKLNIIRIEKNYDNINNKPNSSSASV